MSVLAAIDRTAPTEQPTMLIGELAEATGVSAKTIRYYEEIALLPDPGRTAAGYRVYGPEDAARLAFIRRAQQLDLRLDEIAEILALRDHGELPCGYVQGIAEQRLAELDVKIAQMRAARDELAQLLEDAGGDAPHHDDADYCPLIERHSGTSANRPDGDATA